MYHDNQEIEAWYQGQREWLTINRVAVRDTLSDLVRMLYKYTFTINCKKEDVEEMLAATDEAFVYNVHWEANKVTSIDGNFRSTNYTPDLYFSFTPFGLEITKNYNMDRCSKTDVVAKIPMCLIKTLISDFG